MMLQKGGVKIWRPRQIYLGEPKRDYVPINVRQTPNITEPSQEPAPVSHLFSKRVFLAQSKI